MNKNDLKEIKDIIDGSLETHLASVHEEITDVRTELKKDIRDLRTDLKADIKKLDDRLAGVESKVSGIDNRIDDEALKRNDLEKRVRSVSPNLPPAPQRL